jgi:uncharacterized membrane protein YgcG
MKIWIRATCSVLALLCTPTVAVAQRVLTWDSVNVSAHLEADGTLLIEEEQAMNFTGDWNGGQRVFNIQPRQRLEFIDIARQGDSGWLELRQDADLDSLDDYAFTDRHTLRWRSRMPSDPLFANHVIRYRLRYRLSGILQKENDYFILNHDFLFPDRDGTIDRFELKLALDPAWSAEGEIHETYSDQNIPPGNGYTVTVPLRYTGDLAPSIRDTSRPPEIVQATSLLLAFAGIAIGLFFVRERHVGRFAPVPTGVDEAWLREHIFSQPAEVVAAAWDDEIGAAEVVALIARMESEGKLASDVRGSEMTLRLVADRDRLVGYERTLVDKLFLNNRTTTTPSVIKSHYKKQGFNPADAIRKELGARIDEVLGPRHTSMFVGFGVFVLASVGLGMFFLDWRAGLGGTITTPVMGIIALIMIVVAWNKGAYFQMHTHWGVKRAWRALAPSLVVVASVAAYLWYYVGPGETEMSPLLARGLAVVAAAILLATLAAARSRRSRQAIAFRKKLAAGREFLIAELEKPDPALRDEWMPWLLAFGLAKNVENWSAGAESPARSSTSHSRIGTSSGWSGSSSSGSPAWTGFSGGRSGGGGASGSWAAAAGDFAANVAPAGSSSSGGRSGGGGSSSRSSSSGGGGGGGW